MGEGDGEGGARSGSWVEAGPGPGSRTDGVLVPGGEAAVSAAMGNGILNDVLGRTPSSGKWEPKVRKFNAPNASTRTRLGGWMGEVGACPCYYPSEEEFKDPVAYIRSVEREASAYGICKIVPPYVPCPAGATLLLKKPGKVERREEKFRFSTRWQPLKVPQSPGEVVFNYSGRTYTVPEFEAHVAGQVAKRFGSSGTLPPRVLEMEFWREVEAGLYWSEYGNDLEKTAFDATQGASDPLGSSDWNLSKLPRAQGSMIKNLEDTPGVTDPYMYMGSLFSYFAWHVEDHNLYSINYNHLGAPKTWYGVGAAHAEAFERTATDAIFKGTATLAETVRALMNKTLLFSPSVLIQAGIPVCRAVQEPGQYVVTFPRAYHGGFSNGFNIGEAVNFAAGGWPLLGGLAVERYKTMGIPAVMSHEAILVEATEEIVAQALIGAGFDTETNPSQPISAEGTDLADEEGREGGTQIGGTGGAAAVALALKGRDSEGVGPTGTAERMREPAVESEEEETATGGARGAAGGGADDLSGVGVALSPTKGASLPRSAAWGLDPASRSHVPSLVRGANSSSPSCPSVSSIGGDVDGQSRDRVSVRDVLMRNCEAELTFREFFRLMQDTKEHVEALQASGVGSSPEFYDAAKLPLKSSNLPPLSRTAHCFQCMHPCSLAFMTCGCGLDEEDASVEGERFVRCLRHALEARQNGSCACDVGASARGANCVEIAAGAVLGAARRLERVGQLICPQEWQVGDAREAFRASQAIGNVQAGSEPLSRLLRRGIARREAAILEAEARHRELQAGSSKGKGGHKGSKTPPRGINPGNEASAKRAAFEEADMDGMTLSAIRLVREGIEELCHAPRPLLNNHIEKMCGFTPKSRDSRRQLAEKILVYEAQHPLPDKRDKDALPCLELWRRTRESVEEEEVAKAARPLLVNKSPRSAKRALEPSQQDASHDVMEKPAPMVMSRSGRQVCVPQRLSLEPAGPQHLAKRRIGPPSPESQREVRNGRKETKVGQGGMNGGLKGVNGSKEGAKNASGRPLSLAAASIVEKASKVKKVHTLDDVSKAPVNEMVAQLEYFRKWGVDVLVPIAAADESIRPNRDDVAGFLQPSAIEAEKDPIRCMQLREIAAMSKQGLFKALMSLYPGHPRLRQGCQSWMQKKVGVALGLVEPAPRRGGGEIQHGPSHFVPDAEGILRASGLWPASAVNYKVDNEAGECRPKNPAGAYPLPVDKPMGTTMSPLLQSRSEIVHAAPKDVSSCAHAVEATPDELGTAIAGSSADASAGTYSTGLVSDGAPSDEAHPAAVPGAATVSKAKRVYSKKRKVQFNESTRTVSKKAASRGQREATVANDNAARAGAGPPSRTILAYPYEGFRTYSPSNSMDRPGPDEKVKIAQEIVMTELRRRREGAPSAEAAPMQMSQTFLPSVGMITQPIHSLIAMRHMWGEQQARMYQQQVEDRGAPGSAPLMPFPDIAMMHPGLLAGPMWPNPSGVTVMSNPLNFNELGMNGHGRAPLPPTSTALRHGAPNARGGPRLDSFGVVSSVSSNTIPSGRSSGGMPSPADWNEQDFRQPSSNGTEEPAAPAPAVERVTGSDDVWLQSMPFV